MDHAALTSIKALTIRAMSLNIPNDNHPNKMPFSGILTRIGEPSDSAPEGSGGARIMITVEAARKNLDSLLGMAVDYQPDFSGHDPQSKIGVITGAEIKDNAIVINGFIYAADFPELAAEIKANKDVLGFSFEARDLLTDAPKADPIPIVDCIFTGAAILLKEKAAYKTTSLAAQAEKDIDMTPELKEQLDSIAASLAALTTDVVELKKLPQNVQAANLMPKIQQHTTRLEDAAEKMEQAGIGAHPTRGHAAVLRHMAGCMAADAANGKMPHIYETGGWMGANAEPTTTEPKQDTADMDAKVIAEAVKAATENLQKQIDEIKAGAEKQLAEVKAVAEKSEKDSKDALAAAQTKIADLEAAAAKKVEAPVRKTLSTMAAAALKKTGIEGPAEGEKLSVEKLNEALGKSGLNSAQRFALKTELHHAGMLD